MSTGFASTRIHLIWLLTLGVCLAGCAVNPATGKRQFSLISESQEIAIGRQADQQTVATLGLYEEDDLLQAYVQGLGKKLADASERPDLPWAFRVIDDATVNAFALPGGYIYVTRGILAHLNSEAELATVLGHEIGHVTGRHSANQLSKQQLYTLGLGVGMAVVPEFRDFGELAQTGLGILFLKYGRDHEREADTLGLRYMRKAGYDPRPATEVFDMLGRVSEAQGAQRLPGWLSTHPYPEERRRDMEQAIAALDPEAQTGLVQRESYLLKLDGLVYGPDPRQGFFEDGLFLHPQLAFQCAFPGGWKTQNTRQSVMAGSPQNDAVMVLTLVDERTPEAAEEAFFAQSGAARSTRPRRARIHGLPTVTTGFQATAEGTPISGVARFVAYGDRVYSFMGYGVAQRWNSLERSVLGSLDSFQELRDRRALDRQPLRVDLVRANRTMGLEAFAREYPSAVPLETLGLLNDLEPRDQVPAGYTIKRVVPGR